MSEKTEVKVPDIGDFTDVPVIEVLVGEGDRVEKEQSLVTLESDKATMEVPSPVAGTVEEVRVSEGSTVSEGDVIAIVSTEDSAGEEEGGKEDEGGKPDEEQEHGKEEERNEEKAQEESAAGKGREEAGQKGEEKEGKEKERRAGQESSRGEDEEDGERKARKERKSEYEYDVVVLGSGPGGYTVPGCRSRKSRSSSATRRWAVCASTSAASRPRHCCTRPR